VQTQQSAVARPSYGLASKAPTAQFSSLSMDPGPQDLVRRTDAHSQKSSYPPWLTRTPIPPSMEQMAMLDLFPPSYAENDYSTCIFCNITVHSSACASHLGSAQHRRSLAAREAAPPSVPRQDTWDAPDAEPHRRQPFTFKYSPDWPWRSCM